MAVKKFRLKIQYPVSEAFLDPAYLLRKFEGKEITVVESTHDGDVSISKECGYYFPTGWLTEIKESLSFEEWYKRMYRGLNYPDGHHLSCRDAWNAALMNQKQCPLYVDYKKSCSALKEREKELGK